MKTQNQNILKALSRKKGITTLEAFERFRVTRLSARILELRRMGHEIESEWVESNGSRVTRYRLV